MLRQNRLTHDYRDLWIWIKTHTEKNQTIYYCIPLRRICCCIQLKQNRIVHNMYTVEKDSCHWHGYSSSTIYLHKTQLQVCFSTNFGQGIFVIKCENWTILKQCNWLGAKTAQRNVFFQFFFSARIQNEQVIELRTGYIVSPSSTRSLCLGWKIPYSIEVLIQSQRWCRVTPGLLFRDDSVYHCSMFLICLEVVSSPKCFVVYLYMGKDPYLIFLQDLKETKKNTHTQMF